MTDAHETVAALMPAGVSWLLAPLDDAARFRHEAEAAVVADAVDARRRAFATGRRLAHVLLAARGVADAPLLPGPDRAPRWPDGVVGSVAHDATSCLVALAARDEHASLGVDLEPAEPLEARLHPSILSAGERDELPADKVAAGLRARLVFVLKEAAYKALAPHVGVVLEFHDVRVDVATDGTFSAALLREDTAWSPEDVLDGRWARLGEQLLAVTSTPA